VTWGRLAARDAATAPNRTAPIALVRRRDLAWLLASRDGLGDAQLSAAAREVVTFLREAGASFVDDIVHGARRLRAEVEDALWELVGAGRVTGDGFAGLRALVSATGARGPTRARWHARWVRRQGDATRTSVAVGFGAGRWAVLRPPSTSLGDEETTEALARQYLRRYGVVLREALAREPQAPPWRELLRALRRLELRGEIRGGRLVAGFVGEQFALPEALESLRAMRRANDNGQARRDEIVHLSACDPLNLAGILTPGDRVAATLGNRLVLRDGVPEPAALSSGPVRAPRPARRSSLLPTPPSPGQSDLA
jgi:ATP-dependent Lhr-like helicase